jgi:hypothetical protein
MRQSVSPSQLKMAPKDESLDCATHLVIDSFREGKGGMLGMKAKCNSLRGVTSLQVSTIVDGARPGELR